MIGGLAAGASPGADALVDELAEHLRAILRDVLCGHLDADLRSVADELLAEAAGVACGARSADSDAPEPLDSCRPLPTRSRRGAGSVCPPGDNT